MSTWITERGSKHPVLFISVPSPRRTLPCLGKKREALAAAKEGKMVRCIARGPSRRQAPYASFAPSRLVPAQPPGPGVDRVQMFPHLSRRAGQGAVRPAWSRVVRESVRLLVIARVGTRRDRGVWLTSGLRGHGHRGHQNQQGHRKRRGSQDQAPNQEWVHQAGIGVVWGERCDR